MVVRINITMPEEFLELVDEAARVEHRGRSELVREALRSYIFPSPGRAIAESSRSAVPARDAAARKSLNGAAVRGVEKRVAGKDGKLASRVRKFFSSEEDVTLAYIFGSRATGRSGPLSDVDVAVLLEPAVDPGSYSSRRLDLSSALEENLGEKRVDVVVLNAAPVGIQFQVVKEGKAVYCREEGSKAEFEGGVIIRYLDFVRVEEDYMRQLAGRIGRGEMVDQ